MTNNDYVTSKVYLYPKIADRYFIAVNFGGIVKTGEDIKKVVI